MSTPSTGQSPGRISLRRTQVPRPPAQRTGIRPLSDAPEHELTALRLPELRELRRAAQRDEADLSYLRRLLQGRIDILRAELATRSAGAGGSGGPGGSGDSDGSGAARESRTAGGTGGAGAPGEPGATAASDGSAASAGPVGKVVSRLPEILTDAPARHRSSARHVTLGTPHGEEYRMLATEMLAEVELSDLAARTDEELHTAMGRLVRHEQQVSRRRQLLQRTTDECSAEIARRYRVGEAQVDDLLS
ncbi:ABC transporter substrate-binding protein [Streptomyces sp. NPDC005865]|uniref:RsiG family protein n=1 Tax=Streptomyces sp. NPDC005865 TaxID=3155453 RepID=UPI0033F1106E